MAKPGTESDGELTPKQIAGLRALLLAKRRGLGDERRPRESEAPQRQADEMDAASDATAEAESLGLSEHNGRMRKEIDREPPSSRAARTASARSPASRSASDGCGSSRGLA